MASPVFEAIFILLPKNLLWLGVTRSGVHYLMETAGIVNVVVNAMALTFILNASWKKYSLESTKCLEEAFKLNLFYVKYTFNYIIHHTRSYSIPFEMLLMLLVVNYSYQNLQGPGSWSGLEMHTGKAIIFIYIIEPLESAHIMSPYRWLLVMVAHRVSLDV